MTKGTVDIRYTEVKKLKAEYKDWLHNLVGQAFQSNLFYESLYYLKSFGTLKAKHSKSCELDYGIMEFLAINEKDQENPNTPYRIATNLSIRGSTLQTAINRLEKYGFIRIEDVDRWRTGLTRKQYMLTSIGLATVLAHQPRSWRYVEKGNELPFDPSTDFIKRYPQMRKWFEKNMDYKLLDRIIKQNTCSPIYNLIFQKWEELKRSNILDTETLCSLTGLNFQEAIIFNPEFHVLLFERINGEIIHVRFPHDAHPGRDTNQVFQTAKTRIYGHLAFLLISCFFSFPLDPLPMEHISSSTAKGLSSSTRYLGPRGIARNMDKVEDYCPIIMILTKDLYEPFLSLLEEEKRESHIKLDFLENLSQSIKKIVSRRT